MNRYARVFVKSWMVSIFTTTIMFFSVNGSPSKHLSNFPVSLSCGLDIHKDFTFLIRFGQTNFPNFKPKKIYQSLYTIANFSLSLDIFEVLRTESFLMWLRLMKNILEVLTYHSLSMYFSKDLVFYPLNIFKL